MPEERRQDSRALSVFLTSVLATFVLLATFLVLQIVHHRTAWPLSHGDWEIVETAFILALTIAFGTFALSRWRQLVREITERKQAEETLRDSKVLLEKTFASLNEAVFVVDPNTRTIIACNPAAERIFGYSEKEVLGRNTEFLHVDRAMYQDFARKLFPALDADGVFHTEYQMRRRDGSVLFTEHTVTEIVDDSGRRTGVVSVVRDITERKRAAEALGKLSSAVEQAAQSILITDTDGAIEYVNPAFEETTGYSREEVIGKTPRVLKSGKHEARFYEGLWETILSGQVFRAEFINKKKNGDLYYEDRVIAPIRDRQGNITHFVATGRDITERKRAEEALRKSEEKFRTLAETTSTAITVIQGEKFRYVNPATEAISGYAREELLAMDFWDLVHPNFREPDKERGLAWQRGGSAPPRFEFKIVTKGGEERWLDFTAGLAQFDGKLAVLGAAFDITERKRAEEALRKSEEKFRSTLDDMMEGCQIIGFDWRYLYANDAVVEHGRRAKEELLGHTIMEMYPGVEDTEMFAHLRLCMEERIPHRMENEFTYPNGARAWFELSIQPVPEGIFVLSLDITERKQAELALRDSEEKFRDLVENINDVIYEVDESGRITYISPVIEKLSGYSPAEAIGRSFAEFVYPDDLPSLMEGLRRNLSGNTEPHEYRLVSKSGEIRWARTFSRPILEGGRVVGLRGVLRDITEHKRAEEALRESEERYRDLFESANDLILIVTPDGSLEYVNRAWRETLKYDKEEIPGLSLFDIIHPDSKAHCMELFQRVIAGEDIGRIETMFLTKEGRTITVEGNCNCRFADGNAVAVRGIFRDITDRKRMEEALQAAREEIEDKVERGMRRGNPYGLTFRELTLLHLVAAGESDRQIGITLGISHLTAQKHISNILAKMDAGSRTEAGVRAVREGLLD